MSKKHLAGMIIVGLAGIALWWAESPYWKTKANRVIGPDTVHSAPTAPADGEVGLAPIAAAGTDPEAPFKVREQDPGAPRPNDGAQRFVDELPSRVALALNGDPMAGCSLLKDYLVCKAVLDAIDQPDGIGVMARARSEEDLVRLEHAVFGGPMEQAMTYCAGYTRNSLDRFVYRDILIKSANSPIFAARIHAAVGLGESDIGAAQRGRILLEGLSRGNLRAANVIARNLWLSEKVRDKFAYGDARILLAIRLLRTSLSDLREDTSLMAAEKVLQERLTAREVSDIENELTAIKTSPAFAGQATAMPELALSAQQIECTPGEES